MLDDGGKGSSVAVRLALGETQLVEETRKFLEENGVQLDAFNQVSIGDFIETIFFFSTNNHDFISNSLSAAREKIQDCYSDKKFTISNRR